MNGEILVTGARSGLGRFLAERLSAVSLTREHGLDAVLHERPAGAPFAAIIHCAFDMRRGIAGADFADYLADTVFLTEQLARVPHELFVMMSSIDVYPTDGEPHDEAETLSPESLTSLYGITKLGCEAIVRRDCPRALILRAGLLLGPYMRENNLTRLVRGEAGPFSLTAESGFSCVHYEDILAFLGLALAGDITGIYNAVRDGMVTMGDVAREFGRKVEFGAYSYRPRTIRNDRIQSLCQAFAGTSMDAVHLLAADLPDVH